ncbi:MAG: sigma-54 dependent transcriptional regulator [Desulforhabdus sp.]|nr:sigma-54 dependent transcriptional regulator [Desulforhabdus sp.]
MKGLEILVVEDEAFQREMLREFLSTEGHRVETAEGGKDALDLIENRYFDLILLDLRMPDMDGLETLREIKKDNPEMDTLIVTAFGTIETAVEAMKAGARDYITKPIDIEELSLLIRRIADHRTLVKENEILRQALKSKGVKGDDVILHKSGEMAELINLAGRIAPSSTSVLLQGETGTGKELFAKLIHSLSPKAEGPLIAVNCAAIPEPLLESELFGHEKGAFTGAVQRRIGRFEQADGGTLFLDEIGELTMPVQSKLLRFLQEREFQRLGGNKTLHADVRIISATHQELEAKVSEGSFREDLFYRINVITMKIPPLRERRVDIPLLAEHFIQRFAEQNRKQIEGMSREARDLLIRYDYPGNVRELENIIERAVVICRGSILVAEDFPFRQPTNEKATDAQYAKGKLQDAVEALERRLIRIALEEAGQNQTRAAKSLGLSERMLRYKLKKYRFK